MTETVRFAYAGLGRRFAAWCVDSLILFLMLILMGLSIRLLHATGLWMPADAGTPPDEVWRALGWGSKLIFMLTFVISLGPLYFVIFHASPWQATLGKRVVNTYVTDNEGRRISIGRGLRRWFIAFFLAGFGASLVSVITIAATAEHKALHDSLANTLVLEGKPFSNEPLGFWRIIVAFVLPFVWMLGTFLAIY